MNKNTQLQYTKTSKTTPTHTPKKNKSKAKKFDIFLQNTTHKESLVQQLLSDIQGKEETVAGKGHCMFLAFILAIKKQTFFISLQINPRGGRTSRMDKRSASHPVYKYTTIFPS